MCPLANPTAYAVPEGPDHERLEPSTWQQEDARRPHVPVHGDGGGAPCQRHCLYARLLPQPVSRHFHLACCYRSVFSLHWTLHLLRCLKVESLIKNAYTAFGCYSALVCDASKYLTFRKFDYFVK